MQQVNLYGKSLRPKINWLSSRYLVLFLGVFLAVLVLISLFQQYQLHKYQSQLQDKQLALQSMQASLTAVQKNYKPRETGLLEKEVEVLKSQHKQYSSVITTLEMLQKEQPFLFSSAMHALAVEASPRLSLNYFYLYEKGERAVLKGSSMQASTVPDYLGQLQKSTVFHGTDFGLSAIEKHGSGSRYRFFTHHYSQYNDLQKDGRRTQSSTHNADVFH